MTPGRSIYGDLEALAHELLHAFATYTNVAPAMFARNGFVLEGVSGLSGRIRSPEHFVAAMTRRRESRLVADALPRGTLE